MAGKPIDTEVLSKKVEDKFGGRVKMYKPSCKGASYPALFHCLDCDYVWESRVRTVLAYKVPKCPHCQGRYPHTFEEVREKVIIASDGTLDMYREYFKDTRTKALMICNNGHEIWLKPLSVYSGGRRCGKCSRHAPVTYEEATERLDKIYGKGQVFVYQEDYKNTRNPIEAHCAKGHSWITTVGILLQHHGCPICITTSLELKIMEVLNKKKVLYEHNKGLEGCNWNNSIVPLRPDFRFKNYPIILECGGKQHFIDKIYGKERFALDIERDKFKNQFCKENGFIMIRITSCNKWGTKNHITIDKAINLLENEITDEGIVNVEAFKPYDFNRE